MNITYKNSSRKMEMEIAKDIVIKVLGDKNINILVKDSNALTRFGVCKTIDDKNFEISISKQIVKTEDVINTCIHELLHARNPFVHHSGNWKKEAYIISQKTPYNITRTSNKETKSTLNRKYKRFCSNCHRMTGASSKKSKRFLHPEYYRSGCCGAKIYVREEE